MRKLPILTCAFVAAGAFPVLAATTALSPDEIKSTFGTGKPFTATSLSGKVYLFTFKPDGSAVEVVKGKKKATTGAWRVSDKGYCTKWGGGTEHCYSVSKVSDHYEVRDAGGHLISNWTP